MKKIFILMFMTILLVGTISATLEFDNIISYEYKDGVENKVAIIKNAFGLPIIGETIAKAELITSMNNLVIRGENRKVMIWNIENYGEDYENGLNTFDILNMRNSRLENKNYHLEYAIYEDVIVLDYETICEEKFSVQMNMMIENCEKIAVGNHTESQVTDWEILEGNTIPKGNTTIALVTDVKAGDHYDGFPNLFGKDVKKWAEWTESLNEGLVAYYKFEESSGNVIDSLGVSDGTNDGAEQGVSGKIGNSVEFVSANTDTITFPSTATVGGHGFSLGFWVYPHSDTDTRLISQRAATQDWQVYLYSAVANNPIYFSKDTSGAPTEANSIIPVQTNTWSHVMITYNSTGGVHFYINGSETTSGTLSGLIDTNINNIWLGTSNAGGEAYDGLVDELLISDRTFSSDEVGQVYNNHTGITWTDIFSTLTATQSYPVDGFNTTNTILDLSCNFTTSEQNITDVTILVYDSSNNLDYTNTESGLNQEDYNKTWTTTSLDDGEYNWACAGFGSIGINDTTTNRTFTIDTTDPQITINEPTGIINHHVSGDNLTLNWSVIDLNLESCWYNYNTTNISVTCSDNLTQFIVTESSNKNLTFYANDSFGHENSKFTSWDIKVIELNQTYNNETTEGSLETFLANIRLGTGFSIASVSFNYNNSLNLGQSSTSGENTTLRKSDFLVPNVNANTNISFYWDITLSDSTRINLTTQNQTVYNLNLDNCSVFTNELLNFTVVDEEDQTSLPNATIEISINLYDETREIRILNFSHLYENVNPLRICLNRNPNINISYSLDSITRYEDSGRANEYYNIVNHIITNTSTSEKITLYDLNLTDSTEFQLTFTGADFLTVENALIYVNRQYISENTFKTVELPKTDFNGQTILHLVRNDVIYNVVIIKDGEVLGFYNRGL